MAATDFIFRNRFSIQNCCSRAFTLPIGDPLCITLPQSTLCRRSGPAEPSLDEAEHGSSALRWVHLNETDHSCEENASDKTCCLGYSKALWLWPTRSLEARAPLLGVS